MTYFQKQSLQKITLFLYLAAYSYCFIEANNRILEVEEQLDCQMVLKKAIKNKFTWQALDEILDEEDESHKDAVNAVSKWIDNQRDDCNGFIQPVDKLKKQLKKFEIDNIKTDKLGAGSKDLKKAHQKIQGILEEQRDEFTTSTQQDYKGGKWKKKVRRQLIKHRL